MAEERSYENAQQQNLMVMVMVMVEYLAQDILIPKPLKEIHETLNLSRDIAFRTLWNLQKTGWVEEVAYGYRISPKLTMISDRLRLSMADVLNTFLPNHQNSQKC